MSIYIGWLFPNYEYANSPPLRSGHLDIKDAQCAKKMMGVKYHMFGDYPSIWWENYSNQAYSCPRDLRASRYHGDPIEGPLKPLENNSN